MDPNPPNPKDFATFSDYERAVEQYEAFLKKSEKVQNIMSNANSDEDIKKGMEAAGFTYHEDATCENPWCQENEICLLLELEMFQEWCIKAFFWDVLPEKNHILKPEWQHQPDCSILPKDWRKTGTQKNRLILWCLGMMQAIIDHNTENLRLSEISEKEDVQTLGRFMYLLLLQVLREEKVDKTYIEGVVHILETTKYLDAKTKKVSKESLLSIFNSEK